jgi:hypothetical protein
MTDLGGVIPYPGPHLRHGRRATGRNASGLTGAAMEDRRERLQPLRAMFLVAVFIVGLGLLLPMPVTPALD